MPKLRDIVTYTTWEWDAPSGKATYSAVVTHVYTDKPDHVDLVTNNRGPAVEHHNVPFSPVAKPGYWTKYYTPGKPAWENDCEECVYLTTRVHDGQLLDFYFCQQGGNIPTMIARWGDVGSSYYSGIPFVAPKLDRSTPYEGK